jgi:site-specific recombinase XerD
MLEEFISAKAAGQLRSGIFGAHVEEFCARLAARAYRPASIAHKLWVVGTLARTMARRGHDVTQLDEAYVARFVRARRARGLGCRGLSLTCLTLLEHLRSAGVLAAAETAIDDSPFARVLAAYGVYLRDERAMTRGTIAEYSSIARGFLSERLPASEARLRSLRAENVHGFLLSRVPRLAPKRAQYLGSALRSFLRFLFTRGETGLDLAQAVLTVRQARFSSIPRNMPPRDVERLLRSCDPASATGRRDHAILLLLARLGLRASEVLALELGDLRWREGEIVVRGKGLIRDRLPLLPEVGRALALYLKKDRPEAPSRRVFLCRKAPARGFSHPSTVSTIVMRALARAGLSPAMRGAHLLRHSLARAMVQRGASMSEIGQILRHRSPNTTEIYAKLDFSGLRDIALPWPTLRGAR